MLVAVPVALSALPAVSQTITYEVRFEGNWTLASTPGGVVRGAHFTTLIGGVHGSGVAFWEAGRQASPGVELVAELGSTPTFRSEVVASPHTLSVIQQGVAGGGTGTATFNIDVTRTHPLVTLLSMIGPSPDWFVGVSGVSLLDGSGRWRQSHVVDLFPYDAGTEEGTEFSLSNPDTNPQGVITRIAGTGKFSNERMARLTFTRKTAPPPPPPPPVSLSVSPNPVDEGQPVTVTARLSGALANSVSIPLALTAGTAEAGDFGTLANITIAAGRTTGSGTIATAQDADEDDETFTVSLGALPREVTMGDPSSVEVTIIDDDRRAGRAVDGTGPGRNRRHPGRSRRRPGRDGGRGTGDQRREPLPGVRASASLRDCREPRRTWRACDARPDSGERSRRRRCRDDVGVGQRPLRH